MQGTCCCKVAQGAKDEMTAAKHKKQNLVVLVEVNLGLLHQFLKVKMRKSKMQARNTVLVCT